MNITRSDLLPCPFCGHAPELEKVGRDWWRVKHPHVMECLIDDMGFEYPQNDESLAYAISDWNKRTQAEAAPVAEAAASVYHFQWREIGESGWQCCDYAWFLYCEKSPEHDTRVVEAAPPHDAELVELLRDCRRYADKAWPDGVHSYRANSISGSLTERIDTCLATLPRT